MRAIRSLCLPHQDSPYKQITVSVGISLTSGREDSASQLLQRADAALYRAKRQGRNTCCLGETSSPGSVVNMGDYFKNTPKDTG